MQSPNRALRQSFSERLGDFANSFSGQAEAIVTIMAPDARNCQAYECQRSPTQVRLIRVGLPMAKFTRLSAGLSYAGEVN